MTTFTGSKTFFTEYRTVTVAPILHPPATPTSRLTATGRRWNLPASIRDR